MVFDSNDMPFVHYIMGNLPNSVFWKDKDLVFKWCNQQFAKQFGFDDPRLVIGKSDYDFPWPPQLRDKYIEDDKQILLSGVGKFDYEEEQRQLDGSVKTVLVSKVPIFEDKEVIGILGSYTDITHRKQAEEEFIKMRSAKEAAELASEIKSQFIQNMEHDLRTPASGVSQMLHVLAENEEDIGRKEILQKLANASQRLLDLLNDVIAFDKYSSGQLPVVSSQFDLYDAAQGVFDMEEPMAHKKNINLKLEISKDVPKCIISDKHRIFRVLLNLVGNAVKFTKEGYVKILIGIEKQIDQRRCLLKIVVEDTGIGIPEDKIHRIYDRFERCIPSNKGLYPGAGLGLSITRQFIDELKGEVQVKSIEGAGTTFTCIIPCLIPLAEMTNYDAIFDDTEQANTKQNEVIDEVVSAPIAKQPAKADSIDFKNIKVLLVEDDEMAQISARNTLEEQLHVNFHLAKTGTEALQLFHENKYDVIFMDIGLPDIIGTDVASGMRVTDKKTPIIALTAHDNEETRKICRQTGISDFLVKPLDTQKANLILQKWLIEKNNDNYTEEPLDKKEDDDKVLDFELCKQVASGRESTAKQLWQVFSNLLPAYLKDFRALFDKKDVVQLYELSHKLKGAAMYAGAPRLRLAAAHLSDAAKSEKAKIKDITDLYNQVCFEITEVISAYKKLGY